jgi:hypothetical protein
MCIPGLPRKVQSAVRSETYEVRVQVSELPGRDQIIIPHCTIDHSLELDCNFAGRVISQAAQHINLSRVQVNIHEIHIL